MATVSTIYIMNISLVIKIHRTSNANELNDLLEVSTAFVGAVFTILGNHPEETRTSINTFAACVGILVSILFISLYFPFLPNIFL